MEIENSYYKKIVYKKNAFEDVKTYIKLNYTNKNILLVSTKSVPAEYVTTLLNSLFCGSENVCHFVARQNFLKAELDSLKDRLCSGNFDLIVAFGGGKCCDVVKYFSNIFGLAYIVCPTTASSLAYFSNYCINPYDASSSFYADFPKKIFIQEQIIKDANCYTNIQGLCFLNSLSAVYVEGMARDTEKERYVFMGLEKILNKLQAEQTNILLCGEDSNLVLMDLLIDFGFYIGLLNREDYYLFNMFCVYERILNSTENMSGKKMLLCAKAILSALKSYIEMNSLKCLEKNNFNCVAKLLKEHSISYKSLKNNQFFALFDKKASAKKEFLTYKENNYRLILEQLSRIKEFCKKVRSVYKYGIEIQDGTDNVFTALAIAPYIYNSSNMVNMLANSGILNCFLA